VEGVYGVFVLPEELDALVSKVYLLSWWKGGMVSTFFLKSLPLLVLNFT
jgi:hypothetical protein